MKEFQLTFSQAKENMLDRDNLSRTITVEEAAIHFLEAQLFTLKEELVFHKKALAKLDGINPKPTTYIEIPLTPVRPYAGDGESLPR